MKRICILFLFLFIANAMAGVKFSRHLLTTPVARQNILIHTADMSTNASPEEIIAFEQILQGYTYAALGSLGGLAGGILITEVTGGDGYDGLAAAVLGSILGYVVGGAWGVYSYGQGKNGNGSFWITLLGSAAGGVFYLIPAPIGAYFAYDWSNSHATSPQPPSALRYKQPLNIVLHF